VIQEEWSDGLRRTQRTWNGDLLGEVGRVGADISFGSLDEFSGESLSEFQVEEQTKVWVRGGAQKRGFLNFDLCERLQ
jgi:hypothetical protein